MGSFLFAKIINNAKLAVAVQKEDFCIKASSLKSSKEMGIIWKQ